MLFYGFTISPKPKSLSNILIQTSHMDLNQKNVFRVGIRLIKAALIWAGWSPASQDGVVGKPGRRGVEGRLLSLEACRARVAFPLAGQQQKKPRGHFPLCDAFFAEARLVVLGWFPGTHTASIFRQFPARSKWLWSIPGTASL